MLTARGKRIRAGSDGITQKLVSETVTADEFVKGPFFIKEIVVKNNNGAPAKAIFQRLQHGDCRGVEVTIYVHECRWGFVHFEKSG